MEPQRVRLKNGLDESTDSSDGHPTLVWPQALLRSSPNPMLGEAGGHASENSFSSCSFKTSGPGWCQRWDTHQLRKIPPNQRDTKFYEWQYRQTLLVLDRAAWLCTLNQAQLGTQIHVQPEKAAFRSQEIKRCLTGEFLRHLPQKNTMMDTS